VRRLKHPQGPIAAPIALPLRFGHPGSWLESGNGVLESKMVISGFGDRELL
jgi:hypothetical protein